MVAPFNNVDGLKLTTNASLFDVRTIKAVAFTVLVAVLVTLTFSAFPDCVIYPKLLEFNVNLFARAMYLFTLMLSKKPKSSVVGLKSEQVNNIPRSRI